MGHFNSIPVRSNGDTERVTGQWWNIIRTKLIDYFGEGAIGETSFTIANNQGAAAEVTGLSFDGVDYRSAVVEYDNQRGSGGSVVRTLGTLFLIYRNGTWEINSQDEVGDEDGVTFSISTTGTTGQVKYTSDNTNAGTMRFRARTFDA